MTKTYKIVSALVGALMGLAIAALGWTLGNDQGYDRGARDASCYALVAVNGVDTPLPVDMTPCPADRRPQ